MLSEGDCFREREQFREIVPIICKGFHSNSWKNFLFDNLENYFPLSTDNTQPEEGMV